MGVKHSILLEGLHQMSVQSEITGLGNYSLIYMRSIYADRKRRIAVRVNIVTPFWNIEIYYAFVIKLLVYADWIYKPNFCRYFVLRIWIVESTPSYSEIKSN